MRSQENNKSRNIIGILIAVICVLVLIIVVMAIGKKDNGANDSTKDVPIVTESEIVQETEVATPEPTEVIEFYEIETPYVNLHYPVKWQNNTRIEIEEGKVYKVHFYATVEGREEQLLFSIGFNNPEGYELGNLTTSDGTTVNVTVESFDVAMDDWTEAEQNVIYGMDKDINFIIQELAKDDLFESAE